MTTNVDVLLKRAAIWAVAGLLALAPLTARRAAAQDADLKPIVVASIGPLEELQEDIKFLAPGAGVQVQAMAGFFLQGVDQTRPIGVYATMPQDEAQVVAFLPVTNIDMLLNTLTQQAGMQVEDAGDGLKKVSGGGEGQEVFVKPQGNWAFVAQKQELLSATPNDPATLIQDLTQQYDFAVRVNVNNVPEAKLQELTDALRSGFEQVQQASGQEVDEATRELQQAQLEQISMLVEETDQFTLGWAVDRAAKNMVLDMSLLYEEGGKLAAQVEGLQDVTTNYAGFLQPDAAATMILTAETPPEQAEQSVAQIRLMRNKALAELDDDESLSAEHRDQAKKILGDLMDVVEATVRSGRMDGGAVVLLEPEMVQFAAGGQVSDGQKLEQALKDAVKLAQETEPEFKEVETNFGAETHAEVTLHTLSIPVPEDEQDARDVLGEELQVVIGTAESQFFVAFGKNSMELLKGIIDKSKAEAGTEVPPFELTVSLKPILDFAAAMNEDDATLTMLTGVLEQYEDSDDIIIVEEVIPRGVRLRIEAQEGVLKVLSQLGQAAGGIGGGGAQPQPGGF